MGRVVHIDTYGNLISDIRSEDLSTEARFRVLDEDVALVHTYADAAEDQLVAIAGSSGFVEIALPNGSAADELAASVGDSVEEL